jgi:hypothetical protein
MNEKNIFSCPACKKIFENYGPGNRHIQFCVKYEKWLKTYIPPELFGCDNCKVEFISKEYLINHLQNCKNKI